jgi:uncharacterized protein YecE (DUF72 family)
VASFFEGLRARFRGHVVCEPRHLSWFDDAADALLGRFEVARVAADPARVPRAAVPGGWPGLVYYRLHGSPQVYYSGYGSAYVDALARDLTEVATPDRTVWCIFDNTARGEAAADALGLLRMQGVRTARPGAEAACTGLAHCRSHG